MGSKPLYDNENRIFNATDMDTVTRDAVLSSIMFFPASEEDRRKYLVKAALVRAASAEGAVSSNEPSKAFRRQQKRIGDIFCDSVIDIGGWQTVCLALLCGQQSDFKKIILTAFRNGFITGWVLYDILRNQSSIQKAAARYCELHQRENDPIGRCSDSSTTYYVNEGNIRHIWADFRNVAHLWAAFAHFTHIKAKATHGFTLQFGEHIFGTSVPIAYEDIPGGYEEFCIVAEKYRTAGIDYISKGSSTLLLSEKESWRVMPPSGELNFTD